MSDANQKGKKTKTQKKNTEKERLSRQSICRRTERAIGSTTSALRGPSANGGARWNRMGWKTSQVAPYSRHCFISLLDQLHSKVGVIWFPQTLFVSVSLHARFRGTLNWAPRFPRVPCNSAGARFGHFREAVETLDSCVVQLRLTHTH